MSTEAVPRVLHVIGAMNRGGAESLIMSLYRAVNKSDIQFDFLVHESGKCDFDDEITEYGGRIYRVPRFTGLNIAAYKREIKHFFQLHHDYLAIHVHIGSVAPIVLRESRGYGIFSIAHSHNTNSPFSVPELAFRVVSFPVRFYADYYLACSRQAGIDRFGNHVVSSGRFAVMNNGIDTSEYRYDSESRFKIRHELGLSDSQFAVGHVGRFESQKNHVFLIHMFRELADKVPDAKLILVGRGPLQDGIRQLSVDLGVVDKVIFTGVRTDIPRLLSGFDAFVFPSLWEGFGIAAIEAQTAGLPCVLSDSLPDSTQVTDLARYLPVSGEYSAWVDALVCVSNGRQPNGNDRRLMYSAVVKESGFDIEDVADCLLNLYFRHAYE